MPSKKDQSSPTMMDVGESNGEHRRPHAHEQRRLGLDDAGSLTSAAVLIGVTALLVPEWLAGMSLGAGYVLISRWAPDLLGGVLRPAVKSAVKIGYAAAEKASEIASEASEQVQDMVAEVRSEAEHITEAER